jgi:hypothetical protein
VRFLFVFHKTAPHAHPIVAPESPERADGANGFQGSAFEGLWKACDQAGREAVAEDPHAPAGAAEAAESEVKPLRRGTMTACTSTCGAVCCEQVAMPSTAREWRSTITRTGRRNLIALVTATIGLAAVSVLFYPRIKTALRGRVSAFLASEIQAALEADARNIERARRRQAAVEAAQFIVEHMPETPAHDGRWEVLRASLKQVSVEGLYCEFGVYQGATINFIASLTPATVHGFDSFEGLPEDWWGRARKGTFKVEGLPNVRDNVRLYKGWFSESLPRFKAEHPEPMAFMHLDADLYSSTRDVLTILCDRIVPGTVMQFDEFFNTPEWRENEYKAFMEFVEENGIEFEYAGYSTTSQQVAVKILGVGAKSGQSISQMMEPKPAAAPRTRK